MVMPGKKYTIKFKVKGRGNKIFTWERFAYNITNVRLGAKQALNMEYPDGYKIVSIKLVK